MLPESVTIQFYDTIFILKLLIHVVMHYIRIFAAFEHRDKIRMSLVKDPSLMCEQTVPSRGDIEGILSKVVL